MRMESQAADYSEDEVEHETQAPNTTKPMAARINPAATLIAGLLVGILVGYAGRPLVTPKPLSPTPVTAPSGANPPNTSNANPSASNPSSATLMDSIVAQTRHFEGNPNAPVTIIEFGDFQ
ncbi:MAG: hypothetical protein P8186_15760 [Anaerolineae bacterium]|jgi:hypothetical protein